MTDLSRPAEEDRPAFTVSPPAGRPPCRFGEWVNVAIPEASPDLRFRCSTLNVTWKPGAKKEKGIEVKTRCATCILYQPKEVK